MFGLVVMAIEQIVHLGMVVGLTTSKESTNRRKWRSLKVYRVAMPSKSGLLLEIWPERACKPGSVTPRCRGR